MTLASFMKFLRRFVQHILPRGFRTHSLRSAGSRIVCADTAALPRSAQLELLPPEIPAIAKPTLWSCARCHGLRHLVERLSAAQLFFTERSSMPLDSSPEPGSSTAMLARVSGTPTPRAPAGPNRASPAGPFPPVPWLQLKPLFRALSHPFQRRQPLLLSQLIDLLRSLLRRSITRNAGHSLPAHQRLPSNRSIRPAPLQASPTTPSSSCGAAPIVITDVLHPGGLDLANTVRLSLLISKHSMTGPAYPLC